MYEVSEKKCGTSTHTKATWRYSQTKKINTIPFLSSIAKPPNLYGLVVSNVTSDRLSLSWKTGGKVFDNFVVEIRESALPSQAMGRTLPSGARSTELTGLKGNTRYNVKVYASAGGKNTPALTAVARTGTGPLTTVHAPLLALYFGVKPLKTNTFLSFS